MVSDDYATRLQLVEVRLENSRVGVLEVRMPPGSGHARHWHPEHLICALTSYMVKDIFPHGPTIVGSREAGEVIGGGQSPTNPRMWVEVPFMLSS